MLRSTISFNQNLVRGARERICREDAQTGLRCGGFVPFDVNGTAQVSGGVFSTQGTFYGQSAGAGASWRLTFGDFDIQVDPDGSANFTVNANVGWERMLSDRTLFGAYLGAQAGQSDIAGSFTGQRQGFAATAGAYLVSEFRDNLFVDGYLAVGLGQNHLEMANATLALDSDYLTGSVVMGTSLSGTVDMNQFSFRPELALAIGRMYIGDVGFTGTAFGLTDDTLILDAGFVTIARASLRPEFIYQLGPPENLAGSELSFAPSLVCEALDDSSSCMAGAELGFRFVSEDGLTRFTTSITGEDLRNVCSTPRLRRLGLILT